MTHRLKRAFCVNEAFSFHTLATTQPAWRMRPTSTRVDTVRREGVREGERCKNILDVGASLSVSSSSATCHMLSFYPSPCWWLGSKSHVPVVPPFFPLSSSALCLSLSNCLFYPLACPSPGEGWLQRLSVDCWESTWTG